ncbi:isoprenylcysteine carboxylmethyltransferase family protein [Botrimarina sp.]|uniref:methyltransferase family protein n=1 Tax=Botrimarina sp. TaxID=2795802 RepID=UPI0032EB03C0
MGDTPLTAWLGLMLYIAWALAEGAIHARGLFQPPCPEGRRAGLTWLQTAFFGTFIVGWLDASLVRWTTAPPAWAPVGWIGVVLVAVGLVVRLAARVTIGRNFSAFVQTFDSHQLVTTGLYRWVRHPAYTGFVGFLVGYPLCFMSLASLLVAAAIGAPALAHRIREEEHALAGWFGEDWARYAQQTPPLFPRLR